jgi:hypothetical protein
VSSAQELGENRGFASAASGGAVARKCSICAPSRRAARTQSGKKKGQIRFSLLDDERIIGGLIDAHVGANRIHICGEHLLSYGFKCVVSEITISQGFEMN